MPCPVAEQRALDLEVLDDGLADRARLAVADQQRLRVTGQMQPPAGTVGRDRHHAQRGEQPLLMTLVYAFVFGVLLSGGRGADFAEQPYILYLVVGAVGVIVGVIATETAGTVKSAKS